MSRIDYDDTLNETRVRAEIEIAGANARRSITRTRLILEAGEFPQGPDGALPDGEAVDRYMLRRTVFPDLIAACTGGWIAVGEARYELPGGLPFAVFEEEIPFRLLMEWERAAYAANPDWLPEAQPGKKKAPPNGSGALRPSTPRRKKTT